MTYELLIQNRAGEIFNYAENAFDLEWTTTRTGAPGKFTFSMIHLETINFEEGNRCRFSVNGTLVFFGYVFTVSINQLREIEVTCYDQIRYLKTNESKVFTGKTAGDIIRHIANDFKRTVGTIEDTGYAIPVFVQENKECFDMIQYALELTTYNTGKVFVFFDEGGKLCLREAKNMLIDKKIDSGNLVLDFEYTMDIDKETYNRIKLVRPNKETGKADTYILQDPDTIAKWGILQYYDQVDENMNEAQIKQQIKTMIAYYNRVLKTLNINTMGMLGVRAGVMVKLDIPELGDIAINKYFLVNKVTHKFNNNDHTMELDVKVSD